MTTIEIKTNHKQKFYNITDKINEIIKNSNIEEGTCTIFVPHTTAGITISENADPDVLHDMYLTLDDTFPNRRDYEHAEGNSDAHIKSIMVGPSLTCIIDNNKLALGIWQGIYFCEFDGPRSRKIFVKLMKDFTKN